MANTEGIANKFIVIKNDDVKKYLTIQQRFKFFSLLSLIKDERRRECKATDNAYIVINIDEPYADEVIEIMKKNGHWG